MILNTVATIILICPFKFPHFIVRATATLFSCIPFYVERIVKKYADSIKDKHPDLPDTVYPHMLRRTHATSLYRDGVAVEAIASALGHASIQTTKDPYAFPSLAQKQEVDSLFYPHIFSKNSYYSR